MIIHRILRMLAAKNGEVFIVRVPAHKSPTSQGYVRISAREDIFSDEWRAKNYASKYPHAECIITTEPASDYV